MVETDLIKLFKEKSSNKGKSFYNIMPIDNISSVIQNGILSYYNANKLEHKSIAMNEIQIRRESVRIPNGNKLHCYANLYFTYHNPMMYKRRFQAETLTVLAIDPNVLYIDGCILSDRNASTNLAKFFTPVNGLNSINFDLVFSETWTDNNKYAYSNNKAIKCAEILVPEKIPYDYILGAFVLNEHSKQQMHNLGFDKKIVINPKVFYR